MLLFSCILKLKGQTVGDWVGVHYKIGRWRYISAIGRLHCRRSSWRSAIGMACTLTIGWLVSTLSATNKFRCRMIIAKNQNKRPVSASKKVLWGEVFVRYLTNYPANYPLNGFSKFIQKCVEILNRITFVQKLSFSTAKAFVHL